jgi:hypothetical protein
MTPLPMAASRETEVIADRFALRRRLGEGAFGVVYEAEDRRDGGRIALKVLRQPEADWLYGFKQEFRAMQGISHPNLITLHELFCEDGRWFFTMELIDGVDLLSYVRGQPERLRNSLQQLLEGLAVLHAAGKVHRDIKPPNVLATREGRVVLLDFGLATQAFGSIASTVVGTPAYMAPEQAASRVVGPPADLYALGVLLYESLTGQLPITGSPLQMLLAKQTEQPRAPSEVAPGAAADLSALCMALMQIDPNARPSAAEAFRVVAAPGTTPPTAFQAERDVPVFVGRVAELDALRSALQSSERGELAAVLVCGESGIGKSLTVRRFLADYATSSDTLVLEGRCHEREAVPYKVLDGIMDALSRALSRMPSSDVAALLPARAGLLGHVFPVLRRIPRVASDHARVPIDSPPQELRQRAFAALRELFTRLSLHVSTVLVIDDLQWADADGLAALCEVLRPPDPPPLLFIGTLRTPSTGEVQLRERLSTAVPQGLRTLELEALGPSEARELATLLLGSARGAPAEAERIASEAGGHPMFVEELTRHVVLGAAPGETKLDAAIWSRLRQLEPFECGLAELIAIAGQPLRLQLAAAAANLDRGRFDSAIATLRASNLVRMSGAAKLDAIEPYHDRIREAVVARIDPERKRSLHEALALSLESDAHRDYEALASHWFDAGDSARSATCAAAAGDEASRAFAFDRAAHCYQQALTRLGQGDSVRTSLRVRLGNALALAGRGALAAPHFELAATECPPGEALELRRRAAEQLLRAGLIDRGLAASREVLRSIGMRLPRTQLTALASLVFYLLRLRVRGLHFVPRAASAADLTRIDTCWSIGWNIAFVETVVGYLFSVRALLLALKAGDQERITCALGIVTACSAIGGGRAWPRTERYLQHVHELGSRTQDFRSRVFALAAVGGAYHLNGRFREAAEQLARLLDMLNDGSNGLTHERVMCRMFLLQALSFTGGFRDLRRIHREGLLDAFARGDVYATVNLRIGSSNLAWLAEDRPAVADEQAREAIEQWSKSGFHNEHAYALVARIHARSYLGDVAAAYALANEFVQRGQRALTWRIQVMRVRALYARGTLALAMIAAGQGDRKSLLRGAARDARALERENLAWISPFARVVRAGIALHSGSREAALEGLDQAALDFAGGDMLAFAATARARAGVLRGDLDEVKRAEDFLRSEEVIAPQRMFRLLMPSFDL